MRQQSQRRDLSGLFLLDKPVGVSSNIAVQICKRLFRAKKAGHGGCLDPLASGVLPIYFGQATKFSHYGLSAEKHYRVTACLGRTTTTGDAEGDVVSESPVPDCSLADLESICHSFLGDSMQVPPMYSALKHEGQPLYKLARQGKEIERQPRAITIHALYLVGRQNNEIILDVHCSKGTYIRSLVEDIGRKIGCGATVTQLQRTRSGQFDLASTSGLAACRHCVNTGKRAWLDRLVLPTCTAVSTLPRCVLSHSDARRFLHGQHVVAAFDVPLDVSVAVFAGADIFLGVAECKVGHRLVPKRVMQQDLSLLHALI